MSEAVAGIGDRLYLRIARTWAAGILRREHGFGFREAREAVDDLDPAMVADLAAAQGSSVGAIGDGEILQWLVDHREEFLKLVMAIVQIVLMFADKK